MRIAYVRWLDACYQDGERTIADIDPHCELTYVGFVVKEDAESLTLALEAPHEGLTRNPFTIRKVNIVERRERNARSVFRLEKQ